MPSVDSHVYSATPPFGAESYFNAMRDLRLGRCTPDEFRAIMRGFKASVGEAKHDQFKAVAAAALNAR